MGGNRVTQSSNDGRNDLGIALARSIALLRWTADTVTGTDLPPFREPDERKRKRAHLGGACLHAAIGHSQAIVVLVESGLRGSALALARAAVEAWVRGMWLLRAATEEEIDDAGRDRFPNNFNRLVADLEGKGGIEEGMLSGVKNAEWNTLCSYTHTGFQQIGGRLTATGLSDGFTDDEAMYALMWADNVSLMAVGQIAVLAARADVALAALVRMNRLRQGSK